MNARPSTEEAVAEFLSAHYCSALSERERHVYRQALHALVRLAKSELMMEMRANVKKLTGVAPKRPRERSRHAAAPRQQQFEFHQQR